jgi:hypothetical protein
MAQADGLVLPQTLDTLPVSATVRHRAASRAPAVRREPAWQRAVTAVARLLRRLP